RVVVALGGLVEDRNVLAARVERSLLRRDLRLVADLVDVDMDVRPGARITRLTEKGLRGAVECVPPRLLEPVEVGATDLRPRVADGGSVGVQIGIAMDRDLVRDWLGSPARAIRLTDLFQKSDRGVRHVARRFEVVVAARREAEGDHRDLRVDSLDRVVTGGHRLLLHVPGDALTAVVELWLVKG